MNKEQLAGLLEQIAYPVRNISDIEMLARENNLVILYGASDDLMEFRGAIYDEVSAYNGGFALINESGIISSDAIEEVEDGDSEDIKSIMAAFPKAKAIKAVWCGLDDYAWSYETDIPHACFDVVRGDEGMYCKGIVFSLDDLDGNQSKVALFPKNKPIGFNSAWSDDQCRYAHEAITSFDANQKLIKDLEHENNLLKSELKILKAANSEL